MLNAFVNITFARMRSSLTRKRVLPAPEAISILLRIFFRGISAGEAGDEVHKIE